MSDKPEKSQNVLILSGLLADLVVRSTAKGEPVANGTLVVIDGYRADGGVNQQFLKLVFWKGLATKASELPNRAKVRVTGRLETTSWLDRESGNRKYRLQVVAHSLEPIEHLQDVPTPKEKAKPEIVQQAPLTPGYPPKGGTMTGAEIAHAMLSKSSAITPASPITDEDIPF